MLASWTLPSLYIMLIHFSRLHNERQGFPAAALAKIACTICISFISYACYTRDSVRK